MEDRIIWDFLMEKIKNPYGVSALMGNLYVESKLIPNFLQSSCARKLGMTSDQYTYAVDNGTYDNFVKDSCGYGLAQWTYWSRKEALLNYAKSCNTSIGNLNMQLNYLWIEIQTYKGVMPVLQNTKSIKEASDVITKQYEKPKTITEKTLQTRADYGQQFYDKFAIQDNTKYVVATANVNIRVGNDKSYTKIGLLMKGKKLPYVAESENGWYAVKNNNQVSWVSGEFAKVE